MAVRFTAWGSKDALRQLPEGQLSDPDTFMLVGSPQQVRWLSQPPVPLGSSACLAAPTGCRGSPSSWVPRSMGMAGMTLKRGCVDGSGVGDGTSSMNRISFGEDQAI